MQMNNIYVDELPKSCKDCPCMNNDGFGGYDCNLYYKKHKEILSCDYYADTIPKDCPLQPLSVALAEERKKVIERIRELTEIFTEPQECDICKGVDLDKYVLTEEKLNKILDQIEKEK